jgi:putative phosphoesterase
MKKIIILSDTHGNQKAVDKLRPLFSENDYVVHLGDGFLEAKKLLSEYPDSTYLCAGNCDFYTHLPEEGVLEVESIRIFYCHGHRYGVKSGLKFLAEKAKSLDCEVALYGHTHVAKISQLDGVTLINPGTMSYPLGKGGTYCYLVVHKEKATPVIVGDGFSQR